MASTCDQASIANAALTDIMLSSAAKDDIVVNQLIERPRPGPRTFDELLSIVKFALESTCRALGRRTSPTSIFTLGVSMSLALNGDVTIGESREPSDGDGDGNGDGDGDGVPDNDNVRCRGGRDDVAKFTNRLNRVIKQCIHANGHGLSHNIYRQVQHQLSDIESELEMKLEASRKETTTLSLSTLQLTSSIGPKSQLSLHEDGKNESMGEESNSSMPAVLKRSIISEYSRVWLWKSTDDSYRHTCL